MRIKESKYFNQKSNEKNVQRCYDEQFAILLKKNSQVIAASHDVEELQDNTA